MSRVPRYIENIAIDYSGRITERETILSMLKAELQDAEAYLDYDVIPGLVLAINKISGNPKKAS